ncbi:hypothetical protein P7C71_g2698, partial [Lecanoromycetidae sp. Uapishka_2]
MQVYTTDKRSPRGFGWLWFIRLVAVIFTLIVLGITAGDITDFHGASCSAPSRLSFNLAVAVFSFVTLFYFFLATGPKPIFRILPWVVFGQIALDALMFIFWLAAAATSSYSCDDLCSACPSGGDVNYNSQYCVCYVVDHSPENSIKRSYSPKTRGLLDSRTPRSHSSSSSGSYDNSGSANAPKQAIGAIMTIISTVCLAASLFWFFKQRNAGSSINFNVSAADARYEEAGVPAGGVMPLYSDQQSASGKDFNKQPTGQQGRDPQQSMPQPISLQQGYHAPSAEYATANKVMSDETLKDFKSAT